MKQTNFKTWGMILLGIGLLTSSCTVVRQGEFGIKRKFGKINDNVYTSGLRTFNPFTTRMLKLSAQTENIEVSLNIPSQEGLTIQSEVSILYRVVKKDAPELLRTVGLEYEETIILPVFRSAVADVTSKYYAKDMHSGNRAGIELAIRELMMKTLSDKGILIENVLLKSISLPKNLTKAIEDKLEAEQQAQRMEFILQQEKQEAERKRIQATGERDANKIIAEGLTKEVLQFKALDAWLKLSQSPNSKVIITNGTVPMMMDPDQPK
jgi:regulator of protease activity HflC (stomatin/prohibitin superfamily)